MLPRPARRQRNPSSTNWSQSPVRSHSIIAPRVRSERLVAPVEQNRKSPFARRVFVGITGLAGLGLGAYFLFAPATPECITSIHTICSEAEAAVISQQYKSRWQILTTNAQTKLPEIQQALPEIEAITPGLKLSGQPQVQITRSHPIATVRIGGTPTEILSGGQMRSGQETLPSVTFKSKETWERWIASYPNQEIALASLEALYSEAQTLRPRATTVKVESRDDVEIRLENTSRARIHLHSAEELQSQLRTLQAVFSSSTMETLPSEVDLRFKNIITR